MFCTNCGAQIADDAAFCTNCGTATASEIAQPPATAPEDTAVNSPKKRSKTPIIIGIVIAVIAIAAVVAVVVLNPFATSTSGKSDASASSASAEPTKPQIVSNDYLRIEMPASYVGEGLKWTLESSIATLKNGDDKALAVLLCGMDALSGEAGQGALLDAFSLTTDNEDIHLNAYLIGSSEKSLADEPVGLFAPYWDADGNYIASDSSAHGTLALESAGLTVEDVLSWITLNNAGTFVPAKIMETVTSISEISGDSSSQSTQETEANSSTNASDKQAHGTSYNTASFYGVWIGAFSTRDRAESFAAEAQGKNLPAEVYVSSEWTNLNPTTYYVVSIDHAQSEAVANDLLAKAKAAGYSDAYVKYSGNHR